MYDSHTDSFAPVAEFGMKQKVTNAVTGAYKASRKALGETVERGRKSAGRARVAAAGKFKPMDGQEVAKGIRDVPRRVRDVWGSGKVGQAGLIGTGLLGAGGVAGSVYGGNKYLQGRKKQAAKSSLRKRYESLRSRLGR